MQRLATAILRTIRARPGVAAIEFALVAPVMILVLFSVFDIGTAMWRTTRLEMAARNGAQYAFSKPEDAAGIEAAVRSVLPGWANLTVTPATAVCSCDNGTAANCTTGICTVGGVGFAPIMRISVTVTQPYQHISPITAALFPHFNTLLGNVQVRLH